jgi:hypothetical protein
MTDVANDIEALSSHHSTSDASSFFSEEELSVDSSSAGTGGGSILANPRDEVKEIQNLAKQETKNVRVWRFIVVAMILATGATVSTFTYRFLHDEEESNYESAVSRQVQHHASPIFSKSVFLQELLLLTSASSLLCTAVLPIHQHNSGRFEVSCEEPG